MRDRLRSLKCWCVGQWHYCRQQRRNERVRDHAYRSMEELDSLPSYNGSAQRHLDAARESLRRAACAMEDEIMLLARYKKNRG